MRRPAAARAKLLGVKGVALAAATETNRAAAGAPTMAAIERYTGVLYDALDHRSLPAVARRRLDAQLRIFSGLWGVVGTRRPHSRLQAQDGGQPRAVGQAVHLVAAGGDRGARPPRSQGARCGICCPTSTRAAWRSGPRRRRRLAGPGDLGALRRPGARGGPRRAGDGHPLEQAAQGCPGAPRGGHPAGRGPTGLASSTTRSATATTLTSPSTTPTASGHRHPGQA